MINQAKLPKFEEMLISEETDLTAIRLVVRTQTRIDTGRWLRNSPLWLAVTDNKIILAAVGRRRYIESAPFSECAESYYCHATGQLVLEPIETLMYKRLKMTPGSALKVLTAIGIDIS